MRDKSLTELASLVGKDASWLAKKSLPHTMTAGRKLYDVDEVRAWLAANVRERNAPRSVVAPVEPAPAVQTASPAIKPTQEPWPAPPKEYTDVLVDPKADAVDQARATLRIAAWRVSMSISRGEFSQRYLEGMNKASEELRRSIGAYLEISEKEGRLIPREHAMEVIGSFSSLVVQQLNNFSHTLLMQLELWNGDEKFRGGKPEDRSQIFREFYTRHVSAVRGKTCDEIEAALAQCGKNAEAVDA